MEAVRLQGKSLVPVLVYRMGQAVSHQGLNRPTDRPCPKQICPFSQPDLPDSRPEGADMMWEERTGGGKEARPVCTVIMADSTTGYGVINKMPPVIALSVTLAGMG
ncbi:hypothetical protein KUCAC02_009170, partial [Chaenocephalus aceratus]